MKVYSKANDWGEPTSDNQLELYDHVVSNAYKTKNVCINTANLAIDGDGLGFSIANENIFFYDASKFRNYKINADGSIKEGYSTFISESCGNSIELKDARQKPSIFAEPKCAHIFDKKVGAISAPSTSVDGTPNHGAIAFYHKFGDDSSAWQLRGEIYGDTNETKLGEYAVEFEDEHDLKVISNNYHVNYVSDVLVSAWLPLREKSFELN